MTEPNYITKELAETLKELRELIDNEEKLGIWSPIMMRVDAALELYGDACKTPEPVITRVEVITDKREYINWNKDNVITTSLQDDGRTLKVFVNKTTEEPEMPITKPEFYGELIYPRDKTLYNKAETEVSDQWATALSNFIDELGGDSLALWEWKGITPTPEKVVEYLREHIKYLLQIAADNELEACVEWVSIQLNCTDQEYLVPYLRESLREYRRPQPTLKSQALKDFETVREYREQLVADEELEACCAVMEMNEGRVSGNVLRAIRRPKPTLKSQALKDFETVRKHSDLLPEILDTIENALKSLPDT